MAYRTHWGSGLTGTSLCLIYYEAVSSANRSENAYRLAVVRKRRVMAAVLCCDFPKASFRCITEIGLAKAYLLQHRTDHSLSTSAAWFLSKENAPITLSKFSHNPIMTNARRGVQTEHERFVVNDFLQKLNYRQHCDYRVIAEPNPPEAIIQSKCSTSWVEVTCAFWTDAWAKDKYSAATEGERHTPVRESGYADMTAIFSNRFADVVRKKLEKTTYEAARDEYGPGYLVVSIQNPFFSKSDLPHMQRALAALAVKDLGCFRSIYLHYQIYNFYVLAKWRPMPS